MCPFRGAHPRSRGENCRVVRQVMRKLGSSPLARGKRRNLIQGGRQPRLIPARAGKTRIDAVYEIARAAHPRSRGENIARAIALSAPCGSSPLARGKRDPFPRRLKGRRLIPARAGKTQVQWSLAIAPPGSSPLARGKRSAQPVRGRQQWLIPARAGKTVDDPLSRLARGAHPRSRGENSPPPVYTSPCRGSSPLARGKRRGRAIRRCRRGLIPARAGKTK